MPEIRLQCSLKVPADPAHDALGAILQAIADQEGPWRGFALHISLGDLRLPDVGYVAVPIRLTVAKSANDARVFDIAFNAASLPAAFPGFKGSMSAEPSGLGECTLSLTGSYDLPMHFFGKLLDSAMTPGVAGKSLENFIEEIGEACVARVEAREAEYARYRFFTRTRP